MAQRNDGMAVAALVLGIVGLLVCPVICSVLAMIFGVQARGRIKFNPNTKGLGLANAGFWLGVAGIVFWVVVVAITRG